MPYRARPYTEFTSGAGCSLQREHRQKRIRMWILKHWLSLSCSTATGSTFNTSLRTRAAPRSSGDTALPDPASSCPHTIQHVISQISHSLGTHPPGLAEEELRLPGMRTHKHVIIQIRHSLGTHWPGLAGEELRPTQHACLHACTRQARLCRAHQQQLPRPTRQACPHAHAHRARRRQA